MLFRSGDRFGVILFHREVSRFLRARNGKAHYAACRQAMFDAQPEPVPADFFELAAFLRTRVPKRSLLFLLTALDEPSAAASLDKASWLLGQRHLPYVVMLQPGGVAPVMASQDEDLYAGLAGHLQWRALRELELSLRSHGVRFHMVEPGALAGLRHLRLSETELTELPGWMGSLDRLESLYIEDNEELEAVPEVLGGLGELRELYIGLSKDLPLPASLGRLGKLESLSLVSCQLTAIPEWVFELGNLKSLYIALNPITEVPAGIARLGKLASFDMGYNPEVLPQLEEIRRWLPACDVIIEGD